MITPADEKYYEIYRRVVKKYPGLAPQRLELEPAIWEGGPPLSRRERRELAIAWELKKELALVLSSILTKRRNV